MLEGGDGLAGAADGEDLVPEGWVVQAVGEVGGEVGIADGFAGGELAVAEDEEWFALADALDLAGERFEEGRGADDGKAQAGGDERGFERQFGVLEGEKRLLHADGGEQDEMGDAGLLRGREDIEVGLVVDGPGVGGGAGARGHAGDDGVEAFALKPVARWGCGVGEIDEPCGGAGDGLWPAGEADDFVAAGAQGLEGCLADGAGGAQQANS